MALVGNIIATAFSGNPSIINYDMFVAVFAMLSLLYLIPATVKEEFTFHPLLMLALDVLNALFFFCGAVAMAAELGVHRCSNGVSRAFYEMNEWVANVQQDYTTTNSVTNGSPDTRKRCHEAQATTAFLWFGFAAFAASAFFSFLSSRGSANTRGVGIRRGGPSMSQV